MAQKVIVPHKKNYVPQFLKQRYINSYIGTLNMNSQKSSDFSRLVFANFLSKIGWENLLSSGTANRRNWVHFVPVYFKIVLTCS